jgi:SWIM zinc finger
MPATFTETLPATRSSKHSALNWTPATDDGPPAGLLAIHTDRASATYEVTEFPTGWDGRGFHLAKLAGGTDAEGESYDVFCARNGQDRQCSCKGFAFGRGKNCKHIEALLALIANGWL